MKIEHDETGRKIILELPGVGISPIAAGKVVHDLIHWFIHTGARVRTLEIGRSSIVLKLDSEMEVEDLIAWGNRVENIARRCLPSSVA